MSQSRTTRDRNAASPPGKRKGRASPGHPAPSADPAAARQQEPAVTVTGGAVRCLPRAPAQMRDLRCPWLRAARRTGDPAVLAAVVRVHPPARCPAARRSG